MDKFVKTALIDQISQDEFADIDIEADAVIAKFTKQTGE